MALKTLPSRALLHVSHLKPATLLQLSAGIALWIGAIGFLDLTLRWMEWLLR